MVNEALHRPLYVPELLANALNQDPARPLLQLHGGPMLSVGDVRDAASRHVQALASFGVGKGTRVGMLSANRPEVLHTVNAIQLLAAVSAPMHPLAGFDDHLHVVRDAGIEYLLFDSRYAERAVQLAAKVPGLRLLSFGPHARANDLCARAATFAPHKLVAPIVGPHDVLRLGYSGGTTGKPKSIASVHRTGLVTVQLMMAEWEWPTPLRFLSCTPLSHAGAAMFLPTLLKGGTMLVLPGFDPVAVMQAIEDYRINCMMLVPTMIYALLDHPRFGEFDLSSLETVFYGASAIAPARLKEAIAGADGLLLATPEYNNGVPGVFKNVIDWASRPAADIGRVFGGRPVALIGASPGGFGTILSQDNWLSVLRTLGTRPWFEGRLMVSRAGGLFDDQGRLTDDATRARLRDFIAGFAAFAGGK